MAKDVRILVTGGAGFIGSEFVRQAVNSGYRIIIVDKLTYAGDRVRLKEIEGDYIFHRVDICNQGKIEEIFKKEKPTHIVHCAAETHVDRSIINSRHFLETNIKGTQVLLDASRRHKLESGQEPVEQKHPSLNLLSGED